jgi:hypothetical protein
VFITWASDNDGVIREDNNFKKSTAVVLEGYMKSDGKTQAE